MNSLEQSRIIYALRSAREHLPIACVIPSDHHRAPDGSRGVPREPQQLIEAIRTIFEEPCRSEAASVGED